MNRIEMNPWWPELIQLKDTVPLRELAEKFESTPGDICAALRREGLSRKPVPSGPKSNTGRYSTRSPNQSLGPRENS